MKALPYRVTLREPLLATRIAGDPNSAVSYPYVPGSMVRGAIVAAYKRHQGSAAIDVGRDDVRRLFFDARTRYLNAYPVDAKGTRLLPTPRSLFTVKGETDPLYDFALEVVEEVNDQPAQFAAVAGESRPFCAINGDEIVFNAPQRRINVHTSRDRALGRATRKSGAVFQYDALEEGQTFAGWVLVDNDEDSALLVTLLQGIQRLGGSSNSGYGRVAVETGNPIERSSWREIPGLPGDIQPDQPFIVTLLSDTVIRHPETGQHTWDICPVLQAALGVDIEYVQPADEEEQRGVWRLEEVGGFNRAWGLPLPQAQAIAAGSVFVLRSRSAVSAATIIELEWRGIGERRAEGFGRIAFNWQQAAQLRQIEPSQPPRQMISEPLPDGPARQVAEQMALRMLRRKLDAKLRQRVADLRVEGQTVSNAQLSRLRIILRETLASGDIARLQRYVKENIENRRPVRDQFNQTRIGHQRLSQWLEDQLANPESIWAEIGAVNLSKQIGANVVASTQGNDTLAREYTIRYIDGVLARLAKEQRREDR